MDDHGRNGLRRPLERMAPTGIYLARDVLGDVQRAVRVRAAREGTTLRLVLLQALRDYAAGRWTPRSDEVPSKPAVTSVAWGGPAGLPGTGLCIAIYALYALTAPMTKGAMFRIYSMMRRSRAPANPRC